MANALKTLFTDIAASIRGGLPDVEAMSPYSFPGKIDEIVANMGGGSGEDMTTELLWDYYENRDTDADGNTIIGKKPFTLTFDKEYKMYVIRVIQELGDTSATYRHFFIPASELSESLGIQTGGANIADGAWVTYAIYSMRTVIASKNSIEFKVGQYFTFGHEQTVELSNPIYSCPMKIWGVS